MITELDDRQRENHGSIVALIPDVFFSVTVRNTIRRLGFTSVIVKTVDDLAMAVEDIHPELVIVNIEAVRSDSDWDIVRTIASAETPVLAFGPHRDVERMRRAKSVGVTRVISNGQFHLEMGNLIQRYARHSTDATVARLDEVTIDAHPDLIYSDLPPGMSQDEAVDT